MVDRSGFDVAGRTARCYTDDHNMTTITHDGDPEHPILPRGWDHEIVGFNLQTAEDPPRLDLTLRRRSDGRLRRLRFLYPQDVFIEEGFTGFTGGLIVTDVRARGLAGLGVRVSDFEGMNGAIGFWAREAIDLDVK
jgi:hypothetical protein